MRARAKTGLAAAALLLGLAACTDNDALGNDREAHLDPPERAAEMAAPESLAGVEPGLLKPAPFSGADLARLALAAPACVFRYTPASFPVFAYPAGGGGMAAVKLNGKLVVLPAAGPGTSLAAPPPEGTYAFAGGPVRVEIRHPDGLPGPGEKEEAVLVVRIDGARDELGFAGQAECP